MRRLLAAAAVLSGLAALTMSWVWAWIAAVAAGAAWWALGGSGGGLQPPSEASADDGRASLGEAEAGEREGEPWRLPIEDSLDLHAFTPKDIPDVTDEYLRQAHRAGFREVRVIHGRGTGFQRDRVRRLLSRHPLVERFADAPPGLGGWGATVVHLRREPR